MVKRKERGSRRQILQLHEETKHTKEQLQGLTHIGYSDSSEESDDEGAPRFSQDTNKGKDVIDEQVADFLKEIDAISAPEEDAAETKETVATEALTATTPTDTGDDSGKETNGGHSDDDQMTCPWQQCRDESTGYAYYWNVETNAVTWQCPAEYLAYWNKLNTAAAANAKLEVVIAEVATNSAPSTVESERQKNDLYEGAIIPITSYGSSSDESSEEMDVAPEQCTSRSKKLLRSRSTPHGNPCEYGPCLPLDSPSVQSPQPLPTAERCADKSGEEVAYGPHLPSDFVSQVCESGSAADLDISLFDGSRRCITEGSSAEGLGTPSFSTEPLCETSKHAVSGERLSETNSTDGPSASTLSAQVLSQAGGATTGPLIDYPNSPVNEDESDCVELSTTSTSVVAVSYPVMVGTLMKFGSLAKEPAEGSEPDSTTRASLLVSYGESDSEGEELLADTNEPSSCGTDTDTVCQAHSLLQREKYLPPSATSTTRNDDGHAFGFTEFGDSSFRSKILARKKKMKSVKFVKSDKVLYLSEAVSADDCGTREAEKVREPNPQKEDSDDDFDVLQALDDALMESKKKAATQVESKKEAAEMSREDVRKEPIHTNARSFGEGSPNLQQDMTIDSPAESQMKTGDYSDEIETTVATIMAKLTHFGVASKSEDTSLRNLAVEVQTRATDWRAGALDPRYCWTKLQEAHDTLLLEEASMSLPSCWSCHWDSGTMRYFYTDDATGRSQWDFPCNILEETSGEDFGPQQLSTVTSSTVETTTASPGPSPAAAAAAVHSPLRGEKRKSSSEPCMEDLPGLDVSDDAAAAEEGTAAPPLEQVDEGPQPAKCSDESSATTSKRKKTKLSSGLALRKKNIPSLLEKWEKIKKEQHRENM